MFETLGVPLTHQKVVPGNTITSLSSNCYKYQQWRIDFDAGTDAIAAGDWIVGATSAAVANVVSITISTGAWGDDDVVGYLIVDSLVGTFADNEKLKVAADATCADVKANTSPVVTAIPYAGDYLYKGVDAKAALVVVYANTALVGLTGGKPDQTALIGTPMVANSSYICRNIEEIKNFKCVDYASGSASILQVTYFF
ncbi:hypothetical protein EHM76_05595 [bacterium]|nr:MAG: hypothetical protein EHM76_05595 [bacterium]